MALAQQTSGCEVVVATTTDAMEAAVDQLIPPQLRDRIERVRLRLNSRVRRGLSPILNPLLPFDKAAMLGDNRPFFRSLDALLVTETTSLLLRTRYGLSGLKFIGFPHGAGDRAIGFGTVYRHFDYLLVAGHKSKDRMIRDAGVSPERISIVGYPKFDLLPATPPRLPMQANGRITVLYNPHPAPHLSSWYAMGRPILRYFRDSTRYNLLFAPHVMLFQRRCVLSSETLRLRRPGRIPHAILDCPHIHVDLGSTASTDMSYTQAADIYLGDASSQVYEFLQRPRPCLFLNPCHLAWRDDPNFAHWTTGPVVSSVDELDAALAASMSTFNQYRHIQQELFQYTFDLNETPSAIRAANAIRELMN